MNRTAKMMISRKRRRRRRNSIAIRGLRLITKDDVLAYTDKLDGLSEARRYAVSGLEA